MAENESDVELLSEGDDNGDEYVETDPEEVEQPEDYSQESSEDESRYMQNYKINKSTKYRENDINEEYNVGYNEPYVEVAGEDSESVDNQWHDDVETDEDEESESSDQELEDDDIDEDYLKKENKYNKNNFNKEIIEINNTNNLVEKDKNKHLAHYDDDGVNKTVTYTSIIEKPEMQGRADFTLHQTKNSSGYHFEAKTNYSNEYQSLDKIKNDNVNRNNNFGNKKAIKQTEDLPILTIGTFYTMEIEEEEDYETESRTVSLDDAGIGSDVHTIPVGYTNVETEAVGNASEKCNQSRHTSENEERVKTEILWIKEEYEDESLPMTSITEEA